MDAEAPVGAHRKSPARRPPTAHLDRDRLLAWLRENDAVRLEALWEAADAVRLRHVGDAIRVGGLIDISDRLMSGDEILACARQAEESGCGQVMLQSAEDRGLTTEWIAGLVERIKSETRLTVTLSLGERPDEDLAEWREAEADRYLLRIETSDDLLYERIHPHLRGRRSGRLAVLVRLQQLGYEVGSEIVVGIPGQTWESVACDIDLCRSLDLHTVGIGPFIPGPQPSLGDRGGARNIPAEEQVRADELTIHKVLALTRLACPDANIPSTAASSAVVGVDGAELALQRGANVVMSDLTPSAYAAKQKNCPEPVCAGGTAELWRGCFQTGVAAIRRATGGGPASGGRAAA